MAVTQTQVRPPAPVPPQPWHLSDDGYRTARRIVFERYTTARMARKGTARK